MTGEFLWALFLVLAIPGACFIGAACLVAAIGALIWRSK